MVVRLVEETALYGTPGILVPGIYEAGNSSQNFPQGVVPTRVLHCKVDLVLDELIPRPNHAMFVTHMASQELVMNVCSWNLHKLPPIIDQPAAQIGFIKEIRVLFIESTNGCQGVESEATVATGQMWKVGTEGETQFRAGTGPTNIRVCEPVCRGKRKLQASAGVIVDEATGATDTAIYKWRDQLAQPFRLGYGVIINERYQLP